MDPFATLKELLELIAEYHSVKASYADRIWTAEYLQELSDIRESILEHLENLAQWLNRGGFVPQLPFVLPETAQKAV